MNMRHFLVGLAASTLLLGSASAAFARGHHNAFMMDGWRGGYSMNGNYQSLTEEKRAALDKLMQERHTAVAPLLEQMEAKQLELNALSRNPNTRPEDISKLAQETAELQARIRSMNRDFQEKVQKEIGVPVGPRAGMTGGYGYGMGGYHHMRGWNN